MTYEHSAQHSGERRNGRVNDLRRRWLRGAWAAVSRTTCCRVIACGAVRLGVVLRCCAAHKQSQDTQRQHTASSFPPPLSSLSVPPASSPIRVLFVTDELSDTGLSMGRLPYGGAGTAIFLLARALALATDAAPAASAASSPGAGSALFDVHILHVTAHFLSPSEQSAAVATMARSSITLHVLPPFIHSMRQENYFSSRTSYSVLLFLLQYEQAAASSPTQPTGAGSPAASGSAPPPPPSSSSLSPFHVVHFSDFNAFGYHSLQARRQGWSFRRTSFVLTCHGSSSWAKAANQVYPHSSEELETAYLERRSIEWAPVVISPSNYMLHWMRSRNWQLPRIAAVIPNMQPDAADTKAEAEAVAKQSAQRAAAAAAAEGGSHATLASEPPCELIFFGRLEHRKGLSLFLDAMDRLIAGEAAAAVAAGDSSASAQQPTSRLRRFRLTFWGASCAVPPRDWGAHELIRTRAARWRLLAAPPASVPSLRFISDASHLRAGLPVRP